MSELNYINETVVPRMPKSVSDEQLFVFVPTGNDTVAGIFKINTRDFNVASLPVLKIVESESLDSSDENYNSNGYIRAGIVKGTSGETIYQTVDPNAVSRAEQKDILGVSRMSQEQKGTAQSNINALLARKSELQTLINQLKSDQGWEVYAQAMNAVVGTAKGLSSLGVTDDSSSSSDKGFSDTLSVNVSTGKIPEKFLSGKISNNSTWNNSSSESLSKSNKLNQDSLALSKFKSGESYAKAAREARKEANEQLIKRLEGQIEIIDKCIDSWGKDLGL